MGAGGAQVRAARYEDDTQCEASKVRLEWELLWHRRLAWTVESWTVDTAVKTQSGQCYRQQ